MSEHHDSTANAEQARYWAVQGASWVRDEAVYDLMLAPFNAILVEALAPARGERVLDVGCGFGSTALALADRGAVVHGVDISPAMVERARARARAAGASATFAVGDAQEDPLGGPYDAVVSRFGVMFFSDPQRAFANFAQTSIAGGRLVFVCWQTLDRNPWMNVATDVLRTLVTDAPPAPPANAGPFAFGDADYVRTLLTAAGWAGCRVEPVAIDLRLGGHGGVAGAVDQVLSSSAARALLETAGDSDVRDRAAAILTERYEASAVDGIVRAPGAAWLVQAHR